MPELHKYTRKIEMNGPLNAKGGPLDLSYFMYGADKTLLPPLEAAIQRETGLSLMGLYKNGRLLNTDGTPLELRDYKDDAYYGMNAQRRLDRDGLELYGELSAKLRNNGFIVIDGVGATHHVRENPDSAEVQISEMLAGSYLVQALNPPKPPEAPERPGIFDWIRHGFSKITGGEGNSVVNTWNTYQTHLESYNTEKEEYDILVEAAYERDPVTNAANEITDDMINGDELLLRNIENSLNGQYIAAEPEPEIQPEVQPEIEPLPEAERFVQPQVQPEPKPEPKPEESDWKISNERAEELSKHVDDPLIDINNISTPGELKNAVQNYARNQVPLCSRGEKDYFTFDAVACILASYEVFDAIRKDPTMKPDAAERMLRDKRSEMKNDPVVSSLITQYIDETPEDKLCGIKSATQVISGYDAFLKKYISDHKINAAPEKAPEPAVSEIKTHDIPNRANSIG